MTRQTYAAIQLHEQLERHLGHSVEAEPFGEPDGLGVHRVLRVDKSAGAELAPLLDALGDQRIVEHKLTEDGYLHITFDHRSTVADLRTPFPLDAAALVVKMQAEQEAEAAAQKAEQDAEAASADKSKKARSGS